MVRFGTCKCVVGWCLRLGWVGTESLRAPLHVGMRMSYGFRLTVVGGRSESVVSETQCLFYFKCR